MNAESRDRRLRCLLLAVLFAGTAGAAARAHTVGQPAPFHLSPGDYFTVPVGGGTFSAPAAVQVRFTPVGGGSATDQAPQDLVPNVSVGVRVPTALAVGQYDVSVFLGGVASDAPAARIWIRQRPFRFIRRPATQLPGTPSGASTDFKDMDFADVDNDGFLDAFSANSQSGADVDVLEINQRGRAPGPRDCPGSSDFCNMTSAWFENSVTGITPANRTYDADMVDLDLDGDLDVVRIDNSGATPIRLFLNNGAGHFQDRTIARPGIGPALLPPLADISAILSNTARVDSGDADGDGRPDLILCSWSGPAQNLLLLNRLATTGTFVIANSGPCNPADPAAHALCKIRDEVNRGCGFGDFNNDGRADIIAPTMDPGRPDFVLINTGNSASGIPQFDVHDDWVRAAGGGLQEPRNGGNVKIADLDGDGDDDVLVASPRDEQKRRILWNDAGTRLVELADDRYPFAGDSYDVQLADLDRDGDLDVMMSPEGGSASPVLINRGGRNGNMLFTEAAPADLWFQESPGGTIAASPNFNISLSLGDYDLDGDLDLLTGGYDTVALWRNDLFDQPGEDRDWVFVLDRTGSMVSGTRDFLTPGKNVLKTFLGQRRPGDQAGLVTFDYAGTDPGNPNAADDAAKAQVNAQVGVRTFAQLQTDVEGITLGTCGGFCTAIGWAIKTGKEVAEAAPDPSREKVVVLLTDGEQNQGPHPDTIIPTIPSNVRLYTIALGTETDDRMLSALATNGGKFYFAGRSSDYASVQSTLREIDEDLEGDATGKQPLMPVSRLLWSPVVKAVFAKSALLGPLFLRGSEFLAQARTDLFVVDPADQQVRFTLSWREGSRTNRMVLVDPKGRTYPLPGDDRVRERRGDKSHVIEVSDPLSGVWQLTPQVSSDSGPDKVTATASSALRVTAEPAFPLFYLGEPLVLRAQLSEVVPGVQAQAVILSPTKRESLVAGRAINDRSFEFQLADLAEAGTYRVELAFVGPPQRPFVRHWLSAVHVAQPTPGEPDLRNARLTLDRTRLTAGDAAPATALLELRRRDGTPLTGASVSFVASRAALSGPVRDLGGGRYAQTLTASQQTGPGVLRARVGLTRLPNRVDFKVEAGAADPGRSSFAVIVGPLKLCAGEPGTFALRVVPVDRFGNPMRGARVDIEQTSGPDVDWEGPVRAKGAGEVYERRFRGPDEGGTYVFAARVSGTSLAETVTLPVYETGSKEGVLLGCFQRPEKAGGLPWWLLVLLLLLLLLILFWWLSRRRPVPAGA